MQLKFDFQYVLNDYLLKFKMRASLFRFLAAVSNVIPVAQKVAKIPSNQLNNKRHTEVKGLASKRGRKGKLER